MMQDKIFIKAPAKINLFLHILNKRKDGYHNIRSGITFINLFDEVKIKKSKKTVIRYSGQFKPKSGLYKDCIIKRTLKFLKIYKKINLEINIKKNIPVQAGMGAASTNAASLLEGLNKMNIIKLDSNLQFYASLGKDIPVFLFQKNSLVEGSGEKITEKKFPKYFFLIVKPKIGFSTKIMYNKISKNNLSNYKETATKKNLYAVEKYKNDFDKIAIKENAEIANFLKFLSNNKNTIFSQMTGSGSGCFATFKKFENANKAQKLFNKKFRNKWSFVAQNNYMN